MHVKKWINQLDFINWHTISWCFCYRKPYFHRVFLSSPRVNSRGLSSDSMRSILTTALIQPTKSHSFRQHRFRVTEICRLSLWTTESYEVASAWVCNEEWIKTYLKSVVRSLLSTSQYKLTPTPSSHALYQPWTAKILAKDQDRFLFCTSVLRRNPTGDQPIDLIVDIIFCLISIDDENGNRIRWRWGWYEPIFMQAVQRCQVRHIQRLFFGAIARANAIKTDRWAGLQINSKYDEKKKYFTWEKGSICTQNELFSIVIRSERLMDGRY
jgi:hypothetical protein